MLTASHATTRIELELPGDVLFAMRHFGHPEAIQHTVKLALALFLFQDGAISLGKAAEFAEMNHGQFIELLATHGIAAYEYTEQEYAWDSEAVATYRQAVHS